MFVKLWRVSPWVEVLFADDHVLYRRPVSFSLMKLTRLVPRENDGKGIQRRHCICNSIFLRFNDFTKFNFLDLANLVNIACHKGSCWRCWEAFCWTVGIRQGQDSYGNREEDNVLYQRTQKKVYKFLNLEFKTLCDLSHLLLYLFSSLPTMRAGHAIVALNTGGAHPIHKATIMPRGSALGMVTQLHLQTMKHQWARSSY